MCNKWMLLGCGCVCKAALQITDFWPLVNAKGFSIMLWQIRISTYGVTAPEETWHSVNGKTSSRRTPPPLLMYTHSHLSDSRLVFSHCWSTSSLWIIQWRATWSPCVLIKDSGIPPCLWGETRRCSDWIVTVSLQSSDVLIWSQYRHLTRW